ncbi:hypothetical protein NPIL_654701 [Nephila pilipes]|uniref:Uncharacterized protein n=1 Tax=Nephila pilipes TaxID=299642 RepID=A0A8X6ITF3_NEPPI|nr:hypothetical protein NPIL_654701 [Nephila pilipes]
MNKLFILIVIFCAFSNQFVDALDTSFLGTSFTLKQLIEGALNSDFFRKHNSCQVCVNQFYQTTVKGIERVYQTIGKILNRMKIEQDDVKIVEKRIVVKRINV